MLTLRTLKDKIKRSFPFLVPVYSVMKDWRVRILKWRPTYDRVGLITDASCGFMHDSRFIKSRNTAIKEGEAFVWRENDWRVYVAAWAGEHGSKLDGDFVECGVEYGMLSRTIMEYINFKSSSKKFYLIDTYNGLDERYLTPSELAGERAGKLAGERAGEPHYPDIYQIVKKAFAPFPNAIVVRGAVPEVLEKIKVEKVAYLSIDMNCIAPEVSAAEYFWDKMVPGAIMLLDDYGNRGREAQRDAFDQWAKEKDVSVFSLPTGQGLIIKP
jgi:O-methyltransferase